MKRLPSILDEVQHKMMLAISNRCSYAVEFQGHSAISQPVWSYSDMRAFDFEDYVIKALDLPMGAVE